MRKKSVAGNNPGRTVRTVCLRKKFRMLKKAVQQGRSERKDEAYASVR